MRLLVAGLFALSLIVAGCAQSEPEKGKGNGAPPAPTASPKITEPKPMGGPALKPPAAESKGEPKEAAPAVEKPKTEKPKAEAPKEEKKSEEKEEK